MESSKGSAVRTEDMSWVASATGLLQETFCAAIMAEDADESSLHGSALVNKIVRPVLAETERAFSIALGRINIDDMVKRAESLK